jgi:hypothetical protein
MELLLKLIKDVAALASACIAFESGDEDCEMCPRRGRLPSKLEPPPDAAPFAKEEKRSANGQGGDDAADGVLQYRRYPGTVQPLCPQQNACQNMLPGNAFYGGSAVPIL